jgi:hypothetical protein
MSNSLADILMNRSFDEPEEATSIKNFVLEKYNKSVAVTVREKDILITAQGASFAGALRMQSRHMQRAAGTTKRLIIRIA